MKRLNKQTISLIVIAVLFTLSLSVAGQCLATGVTDAMKKPLELFTLPTGGSNPENKVVDVIGKTIGVFLSVFGIIFLSLMIFGGYKWMMASGREEEVKSAKDTIRAAIIGLIIVVMSYAITFFITNALQSAAK